MRRRGWWFATAAVGVLFAAVPASAHHSRAMFDMNRNITLRGVVTEYRWQSPHSHIVVKVAPGATNAATVGTWDVEASAIEIMTTRGWTRTTYKVGAPITVVVHPDRNGAGLVLLFYAIQPDGTHLYRAQNRYPGEAE
ncbi:MAG: DUF6152 family protein [Pseudomonadota bacterium]